MKDFFRKMILKLPPKFLAAQARKPGGWFGRNILTAFFDAGNNGMVHFMLGHANPQPGQRILEIGFGSGKLLKFLLEKVAGGHVTGLDYSKDMVVRGRRKFKKAIAQNLLSLDHGDLAQMPYADATFDTLCTANTLYFWPNPKQNILELKRVLKPGGKLILGFRIREQFQKLSLTQYGFTLYSDDEVKKLLSDAGFKSVEIHNRAEAMGFHSYCGVAIKE